MHELMYMMMMMMMMLGVVLGVVCVIVVVNLINQDQNELEDLSSAFCSSLRTFLLGKASK